MTVAPFPPHTRWLPDQRGGGRGVRVSAHPESGVLVVSLWKDDVCVGTARLGAAEAAELGAVLSAGLPGSADATTPSPPA